MASTETEIDDHVSSDDSFESEDGWSREQQKEAVRRDRRRRQEQVDSTKRVVADPSLSFAEKVDRLAPIWDWYLNGVDTTIIDLYLSRSLSTDETVEKLAAPIDHLWTTANEGVKYWKSESLARNQRPHCSPEKALELWGPEQDFPRPPELPEGAFHPSCELRLWDLWYGVIHAIKRIDWKHPDQARLIELVKALKARPDPPQPQPMTVPLRNDWIWEEGVLWSCLLVFGFASCECWNSEGPSYSWTDVEVKAWANLEAFWARVTAAEIYDFQLYGMVAINQALELPVTGPLPDRDVDPSTEMEGNLMSAFVWLELAGQYLWNRRVEDAPGYEDVTLTMRGDDLPWNSAGTCDVSNARWKFWMSRLEEISDDKSLSRTIRDKCLEVSGMMKEIAQSTS